MTEGQGWLAEVRRAYLATADRKLADLGSAIDEFQSNPSDSEARQRVRILLHNLIGSGASYGFASISVVARRMSSALKRATDERIVAESDLFSLLRNGLAELRQAFEHEGADA